MPPRPFERGVDGAPTLVQNVETLAHIALIARHGADWFRSVGSPTQPGTALVTLGGAVARPGVYEIALGSPLADLLARGGRRAARPPALLVGGYCGGWLDAHAQDDLALSAGDPRSARASIVASLPGERLRRLRSPLASRATSPRERRPVRTLPARPARHRRRVRARSPAGRCATASASG